MTSAIRDLRFMNAAVAQSNITDYKALVCIFLAGGNDSNNLIMPTVTSEYNNYSTIRTPVLAIPQEQFAAAETKRRRHGLHGSGRPHVWLASCLSRVAATCSRTENWRC